MGNTGARPSPATPAATNATGTDAASTEQGACGEHHRQRGDEHARLGEPPKHERREKASQRQRRPEHHRRDRPLPPGAGALDPAHVFRHPAADCRLRSRIEEEHGAERGHEDGRPASTIRLQRRGLSAWTEDTARNGGGDWREPVSGAVPCHEHEARGHHGHQEGEHREGQADALSTTQIRHQDGPRHCAPAP